MTNELGVAFAPTAEAAMDGSRRGDLEGIPQAMKILSLRLPRVLGAQSPVAAPLLESRGAQGVDPYASAIMQTIAKMLAPQPAMQLAMPRMGLPGGTAGPNVGPFNAPPYQAPADVSPMPTLPTRPKDPLTHWQGLPAPDDMSGQLQPTRATPSDIRRTKYDNEMWVGRQAPV